MNATKHFEHGFDSRQEYLTRYFTNGWRGRLAAWIMGPRAVYSVLYDAAQVGWGIGVSYSEIGPRGRLKLQRDRAVLVGALAKLEEDVGEAAYKHTYSYCHEALKKVLK